MNQELEFTLHEQNGDQPLESYERMNNEVEAFPDYICNTKHLENALRYCGQQVFTAEGYQQSTVNELADYISSARINNDSNVLSYNEFITRMYQENTVLLKIVKETQLICADFAAYNPVCDKVNRCLSKALDDLENANYTFIPYKQVIATQGQGHQILGALFQAPTLIALYSYMVFASGPKFQAYGFQIISNSSKGVAWMLNNVLRTKFDIDFGSSITGLFQEFFFTALPFVVPEYFFNFGSMYKARAANMTLPFLLNCGLIIDKLTQYVLAIASGELPSHGDWIALFGIVISVMLGSMLGSSHAE
jgi:hypothetical protein